MPGRRQLLGKRELSVSVLSVCFDTHLILQQNNACLRFPFTATPRRYGAVAAPPFSIQDVHGAHTGSRAQITGWNVLESSTFSLSARLLVAAWPGPFRMSAPICRNAIRCNAYACEFMLTVPFRATVCHDTSASVLTGIRWTAVYSLQCWPLPVRGRLSAMSGWRRCPFSLQLEPQPRPDLTIAIAFSRTHTGLNSANIGALIYTVRAIDCSTSANVWSTACTVYGNSLHLDYEFADRRDHFAVVFGQSDSV